MAEVTPGRTAAPTDSARPREGRSLDTVLGHLPRGDRRSSKPPNLDSGLPVLLVRVGRYPIHHGAVGVIRTLGRAGVPVYAVTDQGLTPTSISRYLTGQVKLSSGGEAGPIGTARSSHRRDRETAGHADARVHRR